MNDKKLEASSFDAHYLIEEFNLGQYVELI